ncbi:cytochrome d ubiquinol oxidase subunit II [Ktedonospora formicarum]|uniref:Cytochrome D ubiquinol oxidase subunit II n=1 Tax=Ktedonospora formicarum TaxID=2778364 RepID=A0A8J3I1Y7_9CHLR|nr:cytochrome d ubiquinol oxidase subunit II [Ktedonospora formicarum]GHO45233.1 cytochrome D ubiquinol oxidase subunit II [Ktedonospora formicarum]
MNIELIALIILWWALIAYAVLGGADFGAGVWDLVAFGRTAERQREFIRHALGPVWEANHVWLIFLIVGLFTIFPPAFAALSIALFLPFTLVLIGIVLRGAAFIYRAHATEQQGKFARSWGKVFSLASLLTPFFLGVSAAAVASGRLLPESGVASATYVVSWINPFALVIGLMAVMLCSTLAAIYLTVEAQAARDHMLMQAYRLKAVFGGGVTAFLGLLGLLLAPYYAPILWQGMLMRALPIAIITMALGLGTAATLIQGRYRVARVLVVVMTAFMLSTWGLSQYPYIIPPYFTIEGTANEPSVILVAVICVLIGLVLLIPSLYYLFSVFKLPYPAPGIRNKGRGPTRPAKTSNSD